MAADTTLAGLDALDLAPAPAGVGAGDRARRVWAALWPKLAAIALVWVIWELIHLTGWKKFVLPGPGVTLSNLWEQAKAGLLWHAVGDTVLRALIGYLVALVIGTVVGLLVARIPPLRARHRQRGHLGGGLHPAAAAQVGEDHRLARAEPDLVPGRARGAADVRGRAQAGVGVHLARP